MDADNLLASNSPVALVGCLSRWGTGRPCYRCVDQPRAEQVRCRHCGGNHAYPALSRRKLRLIACACCRFVWEHLDDQAHEAVRVAERFAEGQAVLPELTTAYVRTLCNVAASAVLRPETDAAQTAVQRVTELLAARGESFFRPRGDERRGVTILDERGLCDVIRDLIGDLLRPVVIDRYWLDANGGQVRAVAECIDLDGRFEDLPILGDALEEAGCTDERILSHVRRGRHLRGCWLLDAVLGKS